MQCAQPGRHHKCGQCLPCRINARRIWASRIMLEAQSHSSSVFATLTYEVEPNGRTLVKPHLSETMHRLRERTRILGRTLRFFGVGEYGEIGARPHYHAAIFGIGPDDRDLLAECWNGINESCIPAVAGFVHLGQLTPDSAQYIASYATKKLTRKEDPRLAGRAPEFAVMSRRPGIGAGAVIDIIEALNTSAGALYLARHKDVPTAFQVSGRLLPLGPYIRAKLRLFFFGEETQPKAAKEHRDALQRQEIIEALPPMQIDPAIFDRIARHTPDQAEVLRQIQAHYIAKKEKTRRVRNTQITVRHQISNSRKVL